MTWKRRTVMWCVRCSVVGLLAAALLACTSDPPVEPAAGAPNEVAEAIPVRKGVTHGPGTSLGHGFEVAEGSVLVAGTLPRLYAYAHHEIEPDDGWTALMLVTEPGRAVFDRYLRQAQAAGFSTMHSPHAGPTCTTEGEDLFCEAAFSEGDQDDHHRGLTLQMGQRAGSDARPPESSLVMEYVQVGEPPFDPLPDQLPPDDGGGVGQVPSRGWPPLPVVGEPFWTAKPAGAFRVAEGSTLLMHSVTYTRVGTLTLFEVTDEPQAVLERYFHQSHPDEDLPDVAHWERGDTTVDAVGWQDGGGYTLRVFSQPDEPTWLLLEAWPSD